MYDDNYIRRRAYVSRRQKQRRRQRAVRCMIIFILLLLIAGAAAGIWFMSRKTAGSGSNLPSDPSDALYTENTPESRQEDSIDLPESETETASALTQLLEKAESLSDTYDYEGAEALLSSSEFAEDPAVIEMIDSCKKAQNALVRVDPYQVTHVFFHSLIMDTEKAFDGDSDEKGYNQVMTTKDEFLKIMTEMYERGYVLVRLHDIAGEVTDENGNITFTAGNIMLPPDKKPFVLSQDDVCYYEYMEGDGFARRMVIDENGNPACEMVMDDGSISVGSYDLVPLLEDFIAEHPDFSYKGARGVLAFTGYQGILGYRTDPTYKDSNPNYESDCEAAREVAQCLRDHGWELASHSWGHINFSSRDLESVKTDTDKWENHVETLIGDTDIILYPFGSDVGDWHPYTMENEKFAYLYNSGFRYFCNVDSSPYWVQLTDSFMRQGRRNLDGYRMYYDLPETNPTKSHLDDLFDVTEVFDPARPTPVPPM